MLRFWTWFAACVLFVSVSAHLCTYILRDPMESIPGVMFIHVAILPPFFAAISYGRKIFGKDKDALDRNLKQAPVWLRVVTGFCFAYAIVNFIVFIVRTEGGSVSQSQGKYL